VAGLATVLGARADADERDDKRNRTASPASRDCRLRHVAVLPDWNGKHLWVSTLCLLTQARRMNPTD
jgi:hypothetical protein